jgi:NADH dehydrogenase
VRRGKDDVPHVVIVGGGFGGLTAAQALEGKDVRITLLDRTNHHLFQPLLYQVATAGLSPAEIAMPIRSVLRNQENVTVLLAEVTRIDVKTRTVVLTDGVVEYDYLILATGAQTSYFGHDEWEEFAPGLKTIEDAVEIRQRVLLAFELAEKEEDEEKKKRLMTFAVIGGGPTGMELAGALAELAKYVLAEDFRHIDPGAARVLLIEAGPRILAGFPEELADKAREQLEDLGVELKTGAKVTNIDRTGIYLDGGEKIDCSVVLWGAGVRATGLTQTLGVELDRSGRVKVEPDCTIPGYPDAFAIGDCALFLEDGKPLPGVSPVAMQQARTVARSILRAEQDKPKIVFHYFDKGSMATIGRSRAIAQMKRMQMSGFLAWLAWLFVHIWYLVGFRNRIVVMLTWFWSYVTYRRGARLITGSGFEDIEQMPKSEAVTAARRFVEPKKTDGARAQA